MKVFGNRCQAEAPYMLTKVGPDIDGEAGAHTPVLHVRAWSRVMTLHGLRVRNCDWSLEQL